MRLTLEMTDAFRCRLRVPSRWLRGITLALGLVATATQVGAEEAIRWQRLEGVTQVSGVLGRAAGAATSGATSAQFLISSGGGYAKFTVGDNNTTRTVGLALGPRNTAVSITFGFQLGSDGGVSVVEVGVVKAQPGAYNPGDVFQVGIEGSAVVYRQNSVVVYTSATAPAYPLYAHVVLSGPGTLTQASIHGTIADFAEWTNIGTHLAAASGSVTLAPATSNSYEGAVSTRGINSPNGFVRFKLSGYAAIGLSNGDSDGQPADIDYAFRSWGDLQVWENGSLRGSFGPASSSDLLGMSVENGVVKYRRNGALLYTSTVAPTYPLVADSSLYSSGASAAFVTLKDAVEVATAGVQLSPSGGTYPSTQTVTVSSATTTASIYYTLDGSEPTISSPSVTNGGTVTVSSSGRLKARAYASGLWPSALRSEFYAIGTSATTELAEWTNIGSHLTTASGSVTFATGTPATAHEGAVSTRGINSPSGYVGFKLSGYGFAGLSNGDTDGQIGDIDFAFRSWGDLEVWENGALRASLGPASSSDALRVAIENGVVVYKRNGTLVYKSGVAPTYPLVVDSSLCQCGASATLVTLSGNLIDATTAAPTFTPPAGTYDVAQSVVLQAAAGVVIRYTTDGSTPTSTSAIYTAPIAVPSTASTTIKAIATLPGYLQSAVASATYSFPAAAPVFTPPAGPYLGPISVTATTSTSGGAIHYTFNGGQPDGSSPSVSSGGSISVPVSGTLRAITTASGLSSSTTTTVFYELIAGQPLISPVAGSYTSSVTVSISAASGTAVYYTTNGADPTTGSTPYTAPFTLTASATVKAKAFVTGWTASSTASSIYTIKVAAPVLTPATGRWYTRRNVVATTTTGGATLRYTTDGTEPTTSSTAVGATGEILLARPTFLRVKAFKSGVTDSQSVRGSYMVTGQVAGGENHSLALKADGTVWAWGGNVYSQLGDGSTTSRSTPVQVLTDAIAIAAGQYSSYALKADGTVVSWGLNASGQLGDGTTSNRTSPAAVSGLTGVKAIAAGYRHALAVLSDGSLKAWGADDDGQLGRGSAGSDALTPVTVGGSLTGIVAVEGGQVHSMALKSDGTVYAWGYGGNGQLGDGTTNRYSPHAVPGLVATAISTKGRTSYAIGSSSRMLFSWGGNESGQVGDGTLTATSTPTAVRNGVREVGAGKAHVMFESFQGRLFGLGHDSFRQLGDGAVTWRVTPVRSRVSNAVATLGRGFYHVLSVVTSGKVWASGANDSGNLGLGHTAEQAYPAAIASFNIFDGDGLDADLDGDGLDLFGEILFGTDPLVADTNGDGVGDGDEFLAGADGSILDSDQDGVSNQVEILAGTDPFKADTDGDGTNDGADAFPLDPTRTTLGPTSGDTTPPTITLTRPMAAIPIP